MGFIIAEEHVPGRVQAHDRSWLREEVQPYVVASRDLTGTSAVVSADCVGWDIDSRSMYFWLLRLPSLEGKNHSLVGHGG